MGNLSVNWNEEHTLKYVAVAPNKRKLNYPAYRICCRKVCVFANSIMPVKQSGQQYLLYNV